MTGVDETTGVGDGGLVECVSGHGGQHSFRAASGRGEPLDLVDELRETLRRVAGACDCGFEGDEPCPGISPARWRPSSNGTPRSPTACSTRVGTVTCRARSLTSRSWNAPSSSGALVLLVVSCSWSLNQAISSDWASGTNCRANVSRNMALRVPQPTRAMPTCRPPPRPVPGRRVASSRGVRAVEDRGATRARGTGRRTRSRPVLPVRCRAARRVPRRRRRRHGRDRPPTGRVRSGRGR